VKTLILLALGLFLTGSLIASTASSPAEANSTPAAVQTASSAPSTVKAPEPQVEEFKYPIFRAIGGMGLVLCLIAGGYFAVKKIAPQYFSKRSADKNLKVLETLSMGDKRSISIVQVGGSRFLVGNTAHQINLLTSLPEKVSLVSEPEVPLVEAKKELIKESTAHFRKLFEVEKNRPAPQKTSHPLPEDLRTKMRLLREALERG
jgi:flagellar biosynthetic protein FliO